VVVVEGRGDGVEDVVGGGAAAADDDEFGILPGLVEADAVGPGGIIVVFDDVDGVPAESAMLERMIFSGSSLAMCCGVPMFRPTLLVDIRVQLIGELVGGREEKGVGVWRIEEGRRSAVGTVLGLGEPGYGAGNRSWRLELGWRRLDTSR
jgi:hypothetical protein